MPTPAEELLAYDAAIAASAENQWDDQERGIVTPKPELTRLRTLRGIPALRRGGRCSTVVGDDMTILPTRCRELTAPLSSFRSAA